MQTRSLDGDLTAEEIVALSKQYTFWSWTAQGRVNPMPVTRAEGVYFWDADGQRYLDFSSQLMCVNIGHGDARVIEAIKRQLDELIFVAPSMATKPRAEIGPRLAAHMPGDLTKFFFTLGGTEANEHALRLARQFTGRQKIVTRYRSYHGATAGAMSLTGDFRRWANEPGIPGVIRIMDPYKYRSLLHNDGDSDADFARRCLQQAEEVIQQEGPHTIAAVFIETVTGGNGLIIPPDDYLRGLREICDRYGILLICDEVMCGLGRTGRWFAVDHWDVVPDIITMAKGLTSAYQPLGCVAMSSRLAAFFDERMYFGGLTYNSHPVSLAAAVATIQVMEEDDLVGNAQRMGAIMADLLEDLKAEHPSVGDVRSIGLFGAIELVKNRETKEPMTPQAAPFSPSGPEMDQLAAFLKSNGLYTYIGGNNVFTCPPLCITRAQLQEGFEILNRALEITDAAVVE